MTKISSYNLCDKLRPYIKKKRTVIRSFIDVEKQVSMTLFYLSDEGRLRKRENSVSVSWTSVSIVIRQVTSALSMYLGQKYIKLPITEDNVKEKVHGFYAFNFPQCVEQ